MAGPGKLKSRVVGVGGLATAKGIPRSLIVTAWLMELSDIRRPRLARTAGPLIRALADRVRARGIDRQMEERYCH